MRKGLCNVEGMTCMHLSGLVQSHQEDTLHLTHLDLPQRYLPSNISDRLLNLSLSAEKEIVPAFYASSKGEIEHRQKFLEAYNTTLSDLDINKLFQDKIWKSFFRSHC
jgi:hypothetical protein